MASNDHGPQHSDDQPLLPSDPSGPSRAPSPRSELEPEADGARFRSPLPPATQIFDFERSLTPTAPRETFNGRKQWRALLWRQGLRLLGTLVFVVCLLATIKIFQNKGNFDQEQKNIFNVLNLAGGIGLGLNVSVSRWLVNGQVTDQVLQQIACMRRPIVATY